MKPNEHIEHRYEWDVDYPKELHEEKIYPIIPHHHRFSEEDKDRRFLNDISLPEK
jgi:hypothetical protein